MAYIDKAYFEAYTTTVIDDVEFGVLAKRASDVIDMLSMRRIGGDAGLALLPADVQESVKNATAAQVETLYTNGGVDALTGNSGMASATIGKFSYSVGSAAMMAINGIPLSPLVNSYLAGTGLLYRGA